MRLLHTSAFQLKSFYDLELPPYVILSHTWGDEEVTLQEVQQADSILRLQSLKEQIVTEEFQIGHLKVKEGFLKIVGCALQAEKHGFEYIWVDTCCIDKT
jgi:hypothetical protein